MPQKMGDCLVVDFRKTPWKSNMKKTRYNKANSADAKSRAHCEVYGLGDKA